MPSEDFGTYDPHFSDQQQEQCARIVNALRKLNRDALRLGGSLEELTTAADRVEALAESLADVTRVRAMETYRFAFDLDRPNDVLPFNPASGEFNPVAPELEMAVEGEKLIARGVFSNSYESSPDGVHGGVVATVFDQVLAYAVMIAGKTGPTLWLKVAYLKPTPINVPLMFEASVREVEGRKYTVEGACWNGDEKVAEATALMLAAHDIELTGGGE